MTKPIGVLAASIAIVALRGNSLEGSGGYAASVLISGSDVEALAAWGGVFERFGNGYGTGRRGDPLHEVAVASDGTTYAIVGGNGYSGLIEISADGSSPASLCKDAVGAYDDGRWFSVGLARFDNALVASGDVLALQAEYDVGETTYVIRRLDTTPVEIASLTLEGSGRADFAPDSNGRLFLMTHAGLYRFDLVDGAYESSLVLNPIASGAPMPAFAVGPDGHVYGHWKITETIYRVNPTGVDDATAYASSFSGYSPTPDGIAFDSDGKLWYATTIRKGRKWKGYVTEAAEGTRTSSGNAIAEWNATHEDSSYEDVRTLQAGPSGALYAIVGDSEAIWIIEPGTSSGGGGKGKGKNK
jgi:hypothetical protein